MADDIDRAQEREETDRELALAATRERIRLANLPRDPTVDAICIDCNEPIEPERLRLVSTSRCLSCAERFEQRYGARWTR